MHRLRTLIYNTALLTGSSLVMRCIALAFQVWLVSQIGSAGIGLFSLVMSVNMLAVTFAISGIRFASTRLISEELGFGRAGGVSGAVHRCLGYSLFFGIATMLILFLLAEPIGFLWVGDARTVLSLRLLSLSLPFVALSAVLSGYFTAIGRVYKSAIAQISEQLLRIALVAVFLSMVPDGDLERSCAAVVAGGTAADLFSLLLLSALYVLDRRRHGRRGGKSPRLTGRMLGVALPLAVSAYCRTSLSTLEHLLVPRGLRASGLSTDSALSGYGVIQGMVFPIITFPSCLMLSIAELLVPELTEAQVAGRTEYIQRLTSSLLQKCLLFSLGAAALLLTFSRELGLAVYSAPEAGIYIRLFAFLTPIMYLDMVIDGCLKGLGQMMYSMSYNIAEALIGVILVYTLLPKYALAGYIAIICFSECFNFSLSFRRLKQVTGVRLNPGSALLPLLCALGAAQAARLVLLLAGSSLTTIPAVISALLLGSFLYFLMLILCGYIRLPLKNRA